MKNDDFFERNFHLVKRKISSPVYSHKVVIDMALKFLIIHFTQPKSKYKKNNFYFRSKLFNFIL